MKTFGLTGGIATGKSTVVRIIQFLNPAVVIFDADKCVHELYKKSHVLNELKLMFGAEVLSTELVLNRDYMREILFSSLEKRKQLQDFIHPLVRKECLAIHDKASHNSYASFFVADVPLLFENGFDFGQEANLVVATSRKTQVMRLKMRSGLDDDTVNAILEAQLPISYKEKCADVVLWNEGPIDLLKKQVQRFITEQIS